MASLTVRVSLGEPFRTDDTCPMCLFDSVVACLVLVDLSPRFFYYCGRGCGQIKEM